MINDLHAPIAPSSMVRIVQCPGSVSMQLKYPEPSGPEAMEGEAAHWVLAESLRNRVVAVGQIAPNGVVVTDEMIDGAHLACEAIETERGAPIIETRLSIPRVHPQNWGTPDVRQWLGPRHLKVYDYKFGHGFVDHFENWQLMNYVSGALSEAEIDGPAERSVTVDMTIIQPRCYTAEGPVRTWSVRADELRSYVNIMRAVAEEALGPNPKTWAGPECKHCTARSACPTLRTAALDSLYEAGKTVPLDLPTDQAAGELRRLNYAASILDARRSGLEQQLLAEARRGAQLPWFHVEHGQGRETWSKPTAEVLALGSLYGVDLQRPAEPVTPAQARKMGVSMPGFTERKTGEAKLVPDSPYAAAKIFGGFK